MSFTPTTWVNGAAPGISAEQLNRIEQGIEDLDLATISTLVTTTAPVISLLSTTLKGQLNVVVGGNTLKNELNYNRDTWAEWSKGAGVVGDVTGLEIVADETTWNYAILPSTYFKPSTKYGLLYYVVSTTLTLSFTCDAQIFTGVSLGTIIGNNKVVATSNSSIVNNLRLQVYSTEPAGNKIKIKNIRIFELPTGSGIEADFANLTADQLAVKYPYIKGDSIKSTLSKKVMAVGKNLFNKSIVINGLYYNSVGLMASDVPLTSSYSLKYIKVKNGSTYFSQGRLILGTYDINKNWIARQVTTIGTAFVLNCEYIRVSQNDNTNLANLQLELGTVATAYESYTESVAYIPPSTNGLTSVGIVKDEVNLVTGIKTQRNSSKVLVTEDVTSMVTAYTNLDYTLINKPINFSGYNNYSTGISTLEGYTEATASSWDVVSKVGFFSTNFSSATIWVGFAKGTTLATAQAALAGKTLNYQLSTPVVTEIEGLGQLVAEPSGSIVIEPAAKFEAKPATGVLTIPAGWANILTVEFVKKITMNPDGSLTYEAVIPSTNNTTTITLPAGYDDTKFYEVVYLYDSALSTIPDCTYSYPTNVRGEIDSIGDMASQTAENLDELNDFTIAQLIALNSVWKNWTPTLTWTTADPVSITTVARYITIGNTCFFNFMCTSADGNAATQLSISLPVTAKDNNSLISFTAQELVDTTWSNPLAYLDDDSGGITFRIFSAATDTKTVTVVVTGQYEVSVA